MKHSEVWSVPSPESIPSLSHDALSEHIRLSRVNPGHYEAVSQLRQRELSARSPVQQFKCMKCGHGQYQLNQIRVTRTWLSSFFGVESAQYKAVICARCKFTEFYEGRVPVGQQALDVLFGK